MGNVYIVTRIMCKLEEGVKQLPTLGVHSSYKKAMRHYKSVLADRIKSTKGTPVQGQCMANHKIYHGEDRCALLMSDHFPDEEIRLEKWITR